MSKNLNKIDSIIRFGLAISSLILYFSGVVPSVSGLVLIGIGIIFLLTGFAKFCPIYFIFGISTLNNKTLQTKK